MGKAGKLRTREGWRAHLLLAGVCVGLVLLLHLPLLDLPYYWDEAGYYIPAARDFYLDGHLVARSTVPNPHPPLLSIYLAAAWKLFGMKPVVTRVALAVVAGVALYALLLLALVTVPPAAGLWAAALTATTPVFFAQSTLAHLDVAATLGTLLTLNFYLRQRLLPCAIAGTLLCLVRETGALVVLTLAALELLGRGSRCRHSHPAITGSGQVRMPVRSALWLLLPLLPLAAWFLYLRWQTGLWLGNPYFAFYNVWGVLHPARWALQFGKRLYQLSIANFHWVAALLILVAVRRSAFSIPANRRRTLVSVLVVYVLFLSVFGGAPLTRYLLPVFPLFFLLAADAAFELRWPGRKAVLFILPLAFAGCWFWNPPYPFSYEDNLAYADFVKLHRAAVPLLEQYGPGARILTAWPASDELARPWLGYVDRPMKIAAVEDFSREALEAVQTGDFDVLFLFSRQWRPEWFDRYPRLTAPQQRYFGIRRQASAEWIRQRFGFERHAHMELGGQWVEIWAKSHIHPSPAVPIPNKAKAVGPVVASVRQMHVVHGWR